MPAFAAAENEFIGLLPARNLTTFGFLRFDTRPAHGLQLGWAYSPALGQDPR